jgi:ABC-type uncharacterized transport system substrate-binding protein
MMDSHRIAQRTLSYLGLLLLGLCLPISAMAHPHVWTDYWVTAISDKVNGKEAITQLRFIWRFDTMFSAMIHEDLNIKQLTPEAVNKIRTKAFNNLKNFHYYTYIKYDGTTFLPKDIQDFTAREHGEQLEYEFTIALPKPAQKIEVTLYDDELYVDIGPPMSDDGAKTSLMAKIEPKVMPFVSASALHGAAPPDCTQQEGEKKTNPLWGQYKTFLATCTVHQ